MKNKAFLEVVFCMVLLLAALPFTAFGAISIDERTALRDLYINTDGDNWTTNTNWMSPIGTECTWYGVTCDAGENTVIQIYLSSNNLNGNIPATLGNLSNITHLFLQFNHLTGIIPQEIGGLSALIILDLRENSLSGTIPIEVTNLSNLQYLRLGLNDLTGSIPIELSNLSSLTQLTLDHNNLDGPIPPDLGNLSNLTYLYLSNNALTGTIPPELGNLSILLDLNLSNNSFSGNIPPELGNLPFLEEINLSNNGLTGIIPPELGSLSSLLTLNLNYNGLTGTIPPELGNLSILTDLYLNNNSLTGTIPPELSGLESVIHFELGGNTLSGPVPPELVNLYSLLTCYINYNALYSLDSALSTFLSLHCGPSWQGMQTVSPDNLAVDTITDTSVDLSWTAIAYTAYTGGCEVYYSTVSGGPYAYYGITADKTVENMTVSGLVPGTTFYFVIRTKSDPNPDNQNTVHSDYSTEVSAKTTGAFPLFITDSIAPGNDYQMPFGNAEVNSISSAATIQIENNGIIDVMLNDISLGGAYPGDFSIDFGDGSGSTCGTLPRTLNAGTSCTVSATFSPTARGTRSALTTLTFMIPDELSVNVALSGTGLAPVISVSPLSLDLGDVAYGGSSVPETLTVSNNGNSDLIVSNVALSGTNAGEFAIASGGTCGNAPFNVAQGASCTINITLTPSGTGGKSATLTITSNDPLNPQVTVSLSGSATSPRISVIPESIDFSDITEGVTSSPQTIAITNAGSHVLTVSGMALIGTNAAEFTLDTGDGTAGTCGTATPSVPVSGSCSVAITFTPGSTGAKTASLAITSDDPVDSTVSVTLTGSGLSSSVNNPPNAPVLVSPEDGATGVAVPVTFGWNAATDPDGDTVTYDLYLCKEASFAACTSPENIDPITASAFRKTVTFAGMTFGIGFIGLAFTGGLRRRKWVALIVILMVLFGLILYGCSGSSNSSPPPVNNNNTVPGDITYEVTGLDSGVTYYWKVASTDGSESTESEVRSFTIE